MQEMQAQMAKLLTDAEDCALLSKLATAVATLSLVMIVGANSRALAAHGSWMHPGVRCNMSGCDPTYRSTVDSAGERCFGGNCKAHWSCTGIKQVCEYEHSNRPNLIAKCQSSLQRCLGTGVWVGPQGTVVRNVERH
jgi:hypothetical protein